MALNTFIACDHGLVRHALGALLRRQDGIAVVGETTISRGIGRDARIREADVVLLTVDGAERAISPLLRDIYDDLANIPVVLLNLADDDERLLDALALGVRGIVDKNADGARLVECIREVLNGEITISKRLAGRLVVEYVSSYHQRPRRTARPVPRGSDLSDRELEVLSRLARGESNRLIADRMFISIHTVRAHVRSLMQKLQVQNRVQAATYALKHGLVEPPPGDVSPATGAASRVTG